jgi:hypothetical protein
MLDPLIESLQRLAAERDVSFNLLAVQWCEYAIENMMPAPPTKNQPNDRFCLN